MLGLSGVTHVIWFEGIDDFGPDGGATVQQVRDALQAGVKRIRAKLPKVKVIGATIPSTTGSTLDGFASPELAEKRKALNDFIRSNGGLFDGVIDFDKATADPQTGALRAEFVPDSTMGGAGDGLHLNRAGNLAMADAVDLRLVRPPPPSPRPRPRPTPEDASPD